MGLEGYGFDWLRVEQLNFGGYGSSEQERGVRLLVGGRGERALAWKKKKLDASF